MADILNISELGKLEIIEIYDYYDQPILFACKNAAGHLHLVVAADENEQHETWLYVEVSLERLNLIRSGTIDLHDAFAYPESDCLFQVRFPYDNRTSPQIESIEANQVPKDMLPTPGESLNLETETPILSKTEPNRRQGRKGNKIGIRDEKDVMKHVDGFAKILNFDDCKSNGDELIDGVLWFDDTLLLVEVKTHVDSQREIREWARRQIKKARKQIEKTHDKIKSGHHITLTNSIYNGIVLDNNRISNMIGIIVLKCEEDLPFTPYNLDPEMANCDIPIYVFSYKAFLRTAHQMNTIPDFIYHLPERGNELSILGRDFVKQTLGLHIPEDELKLHPSGIHHVVETIPLPRGNSTPVKTNWYPLNMGEDLRLSGKETSFWTEHVENTLIDGLEDPEGAFKEFTSNLRNETLPSEFHLLWALASLPRAERDRASDFERVHRTLVNRKEFDSGGWVHTNHSNNQHIVFHFSKFKSWDEILPTLIQNVKQNIIDKHIPISSCVAVCYDITKVKESPEHLDVSYQLVSTNMLDIDFITKNL